MWTLLHLAVVVVLHAALVVAHPLTGAAAAEMLAGYNYGRRLIAKGLVKDSRGTYLPMAGGMREGVSRP